MSAALTDALGDLAILAGDTLGPAGVRWQDVAGTAAVNLRVLAGLLDAARQGQHESGLVFPSPVEVLERLGCVSETDT
jgi:hypothetical protein